MESKDAAQRHTSQGPVGPDDKKNTSTPQVHQTAYKGLLRLSELFAGIQEEVLDHGVADIFPGGGHFYARHPIIGLLEAVIGTIVFILFVTFTTTYFVRPPSAPRSIGLHLNQKGRSLPAGVTAKSQILNKFQNITGC